MKASEALCPLRQTICHLQNSSRFSIDSPTLEILTSAQNAVASTLKLLETLEVLRDGNGSNKICGLEDDIRDAALELEDVVASHVSDQILSLSESESILAGDQPLLFSLDLQGVRNDIYGFTEKMKKIERELNPWFEEQDSDIFALKSDENGVTRARVMSWFATKAASIFVGDEEEYIQDLENLFSKEEQDGTDEKGYAFLLTSNLKDYQPGSSQSRMKYKLIRWWMDKACSISGMNEPEEENIQELYHPLTKADRDEDDDDNVAINMVGLEDLFCEIRDKLLEDKNACSYVGIVGMAGIGKTVLAKNILQDPLVSSKFEHRLFVRVGQKYQEKEVMQAIVAQLNPEMLVAGEDDLFGCLYNTLQGRKCLIVLDDVWNKGFLFDIIERIPYDKGSQFLLTTRIHGFPHEGVVTYTVPFLNLKESWDLLRGEIFGEQRCPPQLEKAGMKITENCEGLPLLILTVAHFLSRAEKTLEYWNEVSAANKTNSIFIQAYEQILEAVRPSYNYLPQNLKTCFLYMGAFPQNAKVQHQAHQLV